MSEDVGDILNIGGIEPEVGGEVEPYGHHRLVHEVEFEQQRGDEPVKRRVGGVGGAVAVDVAVLFKEVGDPAADRPFGRAGVGIHAESDLAREFDMDGGHGERELHRVAVKHAAVFVFERYGVRHGEGGLALRVHKDRGSRLRLGEGRLLVRSCAVLARDRDIELLTLGVPESYAVGELEHRVDFEDGVFSKQIARVRLRVRDLFDELILIADHRTQRSHAGEHIVLGHGGHRDAVAERLAQREFDAAHGESEIGKSVAGRVGEPDFEREEILRRLGPVDIEKGVDLHAFETRHILHEQFDETLHEGDGEPVGAYLESELHRGLDIIPARAAVRRISLRARERLDARERLTGDELHEIQLDGRGSDAQHREVEVCPAVLVIHAEEHFLFARAALVLREFDDDLSVVRRGIVGAEQAADDGSEIDERFDVKGVVYVDVAADDDVAELLAERDALLLDRRFETRVEMQVEIRFGEDIHEVRLAVLGDDRAGVAADARAETAETELDIRAFAQPEIDGYARLAEVEPVAEFDLDAARDGGFLTVGIYERDADIAKADAQRLEQFGESERREVDIYVGVADAHAAEQGEDGRDVEAGLFSLVRRSERGSLRLTRRREELPYVDLDVKAAEQSRMQIRHTAVQPHFEGCGAVPAYESEVEIGAREQPSRVEGESPRGVGGEQRRKVDIGGEFERRADIQTLLRECREHRDEEVGIAVSEVEELAAYGVNVDAEREIHAHRAHIGEYVADDYGIGVEQLIEGQERGVLVVGVCRGDILYRRAEARVVGEGAEPDAYAETHLGKRLDRARAAAVVHAYREPAYGELLGRAEAGIADIQSDIAHERQRRARRDEVDYAVDYLLGEGHADTFDVEDIAVHVDIDVLEDRHDEPYGVESGGLVVARRGDIMLDDLALVDERLGGVVFRLRNCLIVTRQPRNSLVYGDEQGVDLLGEERIEIEVRDLDFGVPAEDAGEIGVKRPLGAYVRHSAAQRAVRAGYVDDGVGARGIAHVYLRRDLDPERERSVFGYVDVEGLERFGHGDIPEQPAQRAEYGLDLKGVLFEIEVEVERKLEGERRVLGELVEVVAALGDEIGLEIEHGSRARLYLGQTDGDIEFALHDIRTGAARSVEIHAHFEDGTAHQQGLTLRVLAHGRDEVDRRRSGVEVAEFAEVDAQDIAYGEDEIAVIAEQAVGGDETADQSEHAREVDGDLIFDGAVRRDYRARSGREERRKDALDRPEVAELYAEKIVEEQLPDAGAAESLVHGFCDGGYVEVFGLDDLSAFFDAGAVINDGAVEVVETEEEGFLASGFVHAPKFDKHLRVCVFLGVDRRPYLDGKIATVLVLYVVEPYGGAEVEIVAGVDIQRRFLESGVRLRTGNRSYAAVRDLRISGAARRVRSARIFADRITSDQHAANKAQYQCDEQSDFQFSHNIPPTAPSCVHAIRTRD